MQSLDDYRLFLAVADAGSLSAASRATGHSVPTLSRRMSALERALACRLFERGAQGFRLTAKGRALLDDCAPLREVSARLARFGQSAGPVSLRITAGHWTARFLAHNIARVWTSQAPWVPSFLPATAMIDIARREADIGIRNQRPDQSWLAGRATARISYGEYATSGAITGYLAPPGAPDTPSARWVHANHGGAITTGASDPRLMLDLARAGLGRIVLPCFAGDATEGLERLGRPIDALAHDEWLVSHHDARHDPPIRAALDAIGALLSDRSLRPPP